MSSKLFTYRDLSRIHRSVTPVRAPGSSEREAVEIMFLLTDLSQDMIDVLQDLTAAGVLTIPRDAIVDFWQRIGRLGAEFARKIDLKLIDILEDYFG